MKRNTGLNWVKNPVVSRKPKTKLLFSETIYSSVIALESGSPAKQIVM